jgi:hypothetical protein
MKYSVGEAGELNTILAHCLAHARRRFVEVEERFPAEVQHLLESLKVVYRNDARAKQEGTRGGKLVQSLLVFTRNSLPEEKVLNLNEILPRNLHAHLTYSFMQAHP